MWSTTIFLILTICGEIRYTCIHTETGTASRNNKKLSATLKASRNKTTDRDFVQRILINTQLNVEFYLNIGIKLAQY